MGTWVTPSLADHANWVAQVSPPGQMETTTQILARLPKAISLQPQIIVIEAGTWDMPPLGQNSPSPCNIDPSPCENVYTMVTEIQAAGIYVIVCTVPPWGDGPLQAQIDAANPTPANSIGGDIGWLNWSLFSDHEADGTPLADLYVALGQNVEYNGPAASYAPYTPSNTTDGVNPNATGISIAEQVVESAIEASKVKGVFQ